MTPFVPMERIRAAKNAFSWNERIADELDTCFNTDILPNRSAYPFKFPFDPANPNNLYVWERSGRDQSVYGTTDKQFRHEQALSRLFWQALDAEAGGAATDRRRLCVLGSVGSGKSTLVDFFLRWYCPERSEHAGEFARQIIIWFDANAAQDNDRLHHNFFQSAMAWIKTACKAKNIDIESLVARRKLPKQSAEFWVQIALEEISTLANMPSSGVEYLILFVDNMDQCPINVQQRILSMVENLLDMPTIRVWKAIVTMWPSTYSTLKNTNINLIRNWQTFRAGLVQQDKLLQNRLRVVRQRMSRLQAGESAASVNHGEFLSYMQKALEVWSERLGGAVAADAVSDEATEAKSAGLVRGLCNGDLRRELGLVHGFISGEGAHRIWHQSKDAAGLRRRFDYEIIESLLLGPHEHFVHNTGQIGNLLLLGHQRQMPRDLLIGPHMLHLLSKCETVHDRQSLCSVMSDLGYADNNFEHCFSEFRKLGVLHEVANNALYGPAVGYEVHEGVMEAYRQLLYHEPAYLDCVAPVTPVDDIGRTEMQNVIASSPDAFSRKTGFSVAFLRYLRRIENAFCDCGKVRPSAREQFSFKLNSMAIPCLWKHMAVRYRDRLVGLRASGFLGQLTDDWWNAVVGDQVFVDANIAADTLIAAG